MTPDYTAFQVHSSVQGLDGIDRSSRESLNTGRYEKASDRRSYSRSAALHGVRVTKMIFIMEDVRFDLSSCIVLKCNMTGK